MIRWLPVILGAAAILAGCAPEPTATPLIRGTASQPTEWIVALAGTVGAMTLVAPDSAGRFTASGTGSPPGLPANAAWLSSNGNGSELLATTLDGRALLGSPGSPTAWQAAPGDLGGLHPLRAFGSLGSNGHVAFGEGDPGAGTPGRLVVVSPTGTVELVVSLATAPESPAAWLPDGRFAVIIRDRSDEPETLLVDADGRAARLGGPSLRSIAVGGGLVAVIDAAGAVRVGTVGAWLAGAPLRPVVAGDPGETPIQAQPAPSGTELAVVIANPAGDASSICLHAASRGWHETDRFGLPDGANRAVVSWLAVP